MKKILLALILFIVTYKINAQDKTNTETKPRWAMINNANLKGPTGQVIINLPQPATMVCTITKSGDSKNLYTWHSSIAKEFAPGNYDVTFWNIKIPIVVEKGKDTRIFAGVLNSTVRKPWEVCTIDGVKVYAAGSAKMVALPAGRYIVKTGGAEIKTTITDGQTSIFSFTAY
ncbi:MAG: hypothetical protein M3004_12640 [Bacteroidota bacterium]|nr:hypothetical protein [Bacteroidota bacterium]